VAQSQIRFISLPADHLAVLLILGVVFSGLMVRFFFKVDLVAVKELALGVVTFSPVTPADSIGLSFYIHLFLFCALLAYFPFSKMVHMAGVFLSPTRNLANNNRIRRHVNPWNYPVKLHTYEEYEDEFRDVMKAAGLPLDKE
jgi:nitrate reductase gamma subunit